MVDQSVNALQIVQLALQQYDPFTRRVTLDFEKQDLKVLF